MTAIIIYTTEENLIHKKGLKEGEEKIEMFYWKFRTIPKKLNEGDKIYFATKGLIRGYFMLSDINKTFNHFAETPANSIEWRCDSWEDIKSIPTKSFQGFKYIDKVTELLKQK